MGDDGNDLNRMGLTRDKWFLSRAVSLMQTLKNGRRSLPRKRLSPNSVGWKLVTYLSTPTAGIVNFCKILNISLNRVYISLIQYNRKPS